MSTISRYESSIDAEVQLSQEPTSVLTREDQQWLVAYGIDSAWTQDPELLQSLNDTIISGSLRLNEPVNQGRWQEVVSARRSFFEFVGLSAELIDSYQVEHPTLIPLDTFIGTQRVLCSWGIDAAKLVNVMPSAINFAPESVREKMANYASLGIDAAKLVNVMPSAISFAPESVREKMANYASLGIDATKLVNVMPSAINFAPESVREKMANYASLGIDAAKLVNAMPSAISFAPESVREKMANYASLGIDAAKLVNAMPSAINFAPESVRIKMVFLRRSVKLLKWEHSAEELVNTCPALIGFNIKKLAVLRRIAATYLDLPSRTSSPNALRSSLITPLEKYIIAASHFEEGQRISLHGLHQKAQSIRLESSERKKLASEIAPSLGRIGSMYEAYREKK